MPRRPDARLPALTDSYSRLAPTYASRLGDELRHKPLDCALLSLLAAELRGQGLCLDLGCGPGHVGAALAALGVTVEGVDIAPGMIQTARSTFPTLSFREADLRHLPHADGSAAGAVALYALVNYPAREQVPFYQEFARVLRPGAPLLVAFHLGDARHDQAELWGVPVNLSFFFESRARVEAALKKGGFDIQIRAERQPYPDVEYPSERAYLLARRCG